MRELDTSENKKILTLMLITEPADHIEYLYTPLELTLFLINYSFILNDNATEGKILKQDFYPHGGIFFQNSNGARYLDPKYSRWISVDPALGEYVPAAGKGTSEEAGKLPGMGGIYNSVNGNLYHYAGNNPIKYIDPDGRIGLDAIGDIIFSDVKISRKLSKTYYNGSEWSKFEYKKFSLNPDVLNYLQNISESRACTYGAICVRNETRDSKIPCFDAAEQLQQSKYISYYRDESGNIINDPKQLYALMNIGDVLLYGPDYEYYNLTRGYTPTTAQLGFTGHTATIIGKGKDDEGDFFDILEFHSQKVDEPWNEATVKRIYSDTLRTFIDCVLIGGASWN